LFEQVIVPQPGKGLKLFPQIVVIPVGADRNAGGDGGIEIPRMSMPVLDGVSPEEFFIEFVTHLRKNYFLTVFRVRDGHSLFRQPGFELLFRRTSSGQLLECGEVYRETPVAAVCPALNPVVHRLPFREARKVVAH
jgi:hypothetical protein